MTACTIRAMSTLLEFEYSYLVPGVNSRGSPATYERSWAGGGATSSDAATAWWNSLFRLKSGTPLLCWSSCATVTSAHAAGWSGSLAPTVSVEREAAVAHQRQCRRAAVRLGHAGEAHRVAGGDLRTGGGVGHARGVQDRGRRAPLHHDRDAGRSVGMRHDGIESSLEVAVGPARRGPSPHRRHRRHHNDGQAQARRGAEPPARGTQHSVTLSAATAPRGDPVVP